MLSKIAKFIFLILFFKFQILFSSISYSKPDNSIEWFTKSSEHFKVIYNARQERLSQVILKEAERSHLVLTKYFSTYPEQTIIVLNDQIGLANGSASIFPYPIIRLNTTLPSYDTSITDYHNWYYELILHEYVHILNLYPANGIFSWGQKLFGSLSSPNMLLPRWHTEGIAVALETKESTGGRLRSPLFISYAEILSRQDMWKKFSKPVELNETDTPDYPFGMRPYFFGSLFWQRLYKERGDKAGESFTETNARRIPYTHGGSLADSNEKLEANVFAKAYEDLQKKFPPSTDWKLAEPLFKNDSQEISPVFSNDFKQWVYLRKSPESAWQLIDSQSKQSIDSSASFLGIDWLRKRKSIVYSKINSAKANYSLYDLFEYDFDSKKITAISKNKNLSFPQLSPGQTKIVAVQSSNGQESIQIASYTGEEIKEWKRLYKAPFGFRISFPVFLSSEKIAFLLKDKAGSQQIYILEAKKKEKTLLLGFLSDVRFLTKFDGKLAFIARHGSKTSAYLLDSNEKTYNRIANTNTHILDFAILPEKKVLISQLSPEGFKLVEYKQESLGNRIKQEEETFFAADTQSAVELPEELQISEKEEYSSFTKLWPHYWYPWVFSSGGGTNFQINTGGSDPLNIHSYSLNAGYNTLTDQANSTVIYQNNSLTGSLLFTMANSYLYFESAQAVSDVKIYSIDYNQSLNSWKENWSYQIGLNRNEVEYADDQVRPSFDLSLAYNDARIPRARQVGINSGKQYSIGISQHFRTKTTDSFQVFHLKGKYFSSNTFSQFHSWNIGFQWDQRTNNDTDIYAAFVTAGGNIGGHQFNQYHENRGYPRSQFLAYSMASMNFEYLLPMKYFFKSMGSFPVFSKRITAGFVADLMAMDGNFYRETSSKFARDEWERLYATVGSEITYETNVGYFLPIDFVFGIYKGLNEEAGGDLRFAFFMNIPQF
ncbi:MAG: hypothetical protein CL674_12590 [Bdellovibrionaceae bacterium]|nr:hypothetical protein [Pseudobdellovibrionaceae bacterium]|tara:strand:- start:21027 stop:23852 length:2826 start_codon:yes stop_codon:yes gene_type:complete